jgi:hypothetical protein
MMPAQTSNQPRACPECNFLLTAMELGQCKYDYLCPNCRGARIPEFYPRWGRVHYDIATGARGQTSARLVEPFPFPGITHSEGRKDYQKNEYQY